DVQRLPMLVLLVVDTPEGETCLVKVGRVAERLLEKHDLRGRVFRDSAFDVLLERGERWMRTFHRACRHHGIRQQPPRRAREDVEQLRQRTCFADLGEAASGVETYWPRMDRQRGAIDRKRSGDDLFGTDDLGNADDCRFTKLVCRRHAQMLEGP